MICRPANAGDAQRIADIWNPIIRDTAVTFTTLEKTTKGLDIQIADAPCFLVAEVNSKIAGFALYDQFRKGPGYARTMELTIHLAKPMRGQGIGRVLLENLEDKARQQSVGSLWAGIGGENPGSVTFHEKLGFNQIAVLPSVGYKFGRWMDLVLMQKMLS